MPYDLPVHLAPLPDRIGHVGGIESLTLDGRRYYFGFDYTSDLVVSPLIDDPAAMAAFASEYMCQTTGKHDVAYWEELVASGAEESSLAGDDADRTFSSEDLRGGLPEPDTHLLYLLGAVTEWDTWFAEAPDVQRAYDGLGFDDDDSEFLDRCLEAVEKHGARARPAEFAVASFHLAAAAERAPGNWGTLFGLLAEGIASKALG